MCPKAVLVVNTATRKNLSPKHVLKFTLPVNPGVLELQKSCVNRVDMLDLMKRRQSVRK